MPSYVITGVSKGLGWEFLRQLSSDANNTVIGIVRDKPGTDKRVSEELKGRSNISILQADMVDYDALERAAADAARILGGRLDYLISNAGYVSMFDFASPLGVLGSTPRELEDDLLKSLRTNAIGNIHLYNLFMPLILEGQVKKVINISTGHADMELVRKYDIDVAPLYSISKTAMDMVTSKFSAQYREAGVLFLGISPGAVDVGRSGELTEEQQKAMMDMFQKFQRFAPHFTGPATPESSVRSVIGVWEKCSVENGDGGAVLSHLGNRQWL
jgi:NAD(P)-dependent dehydrogenase (short-subunit alcohol dehydrogenase family)